MFLQSPQALANLTCADGSHPADGFKVTLRCAHDRLEVAKVGHDLLDDVLREARDVGQDAKAATPGRRGIPRLSEGVETGRPANGSRRDAVGDGGILRAVSS